MRAITITAGGVSLAAELNDGPSARRIWEALPMEGQANLWGEEIYFRIPLEMACEPEARVEVDIGELGYWEPGQAFCIFFGRTPASTGAAPRAAGPVNIVGRVIGDATRFRGVRAGEKVVLRAAPAPG